jgi:maltooligosyltrehalose trehalohydrolase
MLVWYKRLIAVRRHVAGFTDGRLDLTSASCDEQAQWLRVERGPVSILCNFARESQTLPLPWDACRHVLLASKEAELIGTGVRLAPESVVILAPEQSKA